MTYVGKVEVVFNGKTYEFRTLKSYQDKIQELLDRIFETVQKMQYEVRISKSSDSIYWNSDKRDETIVFYIDTLGINCGVSLICEKDVLYFIDVGNQFINRIDVRPHRKDKNDFDNLDVCSDKAFEILTLVDKLEAMQ